MKSVPTWFGRLLLGGWVPGPRYVDLVLTAVRVFTGLSLAFAHGWGKLLEPSGIIGMSRQMGLPLPMLAGWLAVLAEFVGGLLLAAGWLTRPAAFFIAVNMAVAAFGWHLLHAGDPYGEMEHALLFLVIAVLFLAVGSGRFGVDRFLRRRPKA